MEETPFQINDILMYKYLICIVCFWSSTECEKAKSSTVDREGPLVCAQWSKKST